MANKLYEEQCVQDIANAIRAKNGSTDTYTIDEMAGAINNIETEVKEETMPTNANQITYNNTESGLTATNVQEAVDELSKEIADLKKVSSIEELQTAINSGNKHIIIESGSVLEVSSKIHIPSGTALIGSSATLKRASGYEQILLELEANCRVQDLTIDGNRTSMTAPTWDKTIEITTRANCLIDNVTINNGNEAIVVYGDDCIITNTNINSCGGNGIHFSGANRTRVENCTVIGANKKSGMGHEDGCIIWSNECQHIVCANNWVEDGISGFGSIDIGHNSNVKLIGNTVKDCDSIIDINNPDSSQAQNIIIEANEFINSGKLLIAKGNNKNARQVRVIINENIFSYSYLECDNLADFILTNNIVRNGMFKLTRCYGVIISGNNIDTVTNDYAIYLYQCGSVLVKNNRIRAKVTTLYLRETTELTVDGNTIHQNHLGTKTDYLIYSEVVNGLMFINNRIASYGKVMALYPYSTVENNIILCVSSGVNAMTINSKAYVLARGNRTNGTFNLTSVDTDVFENNDLQPIDDVFKVCTMTLTKCTSNAPTKVTRGDEFTCTLTANDGCTLPTSISGTNNGVTLTNSDYSYNSTTGEITIYCVVGDIVITAIGEGNEVVTDPNKVPTSIDTDGTVFNGTGYMEGYRLSSSGALKAREKSTVSGYIPASGGDIIRISGVDWGIGSNSSNYICAFDSNFTFIGATTATRSYYGTTMFTDVSFGGTNNEMGIITLANLENIAYIRVSSVGDGSVQQYGADMIVTVNEEIA